MGPRYPFDQMPSYGRCSLIQECSSSSARPSRSRVRVAPTSTVNMQPWGQLLTAHGRGTSRLAEVVEQKYRAAFVAIQRSEDSE